MAGWTITSNNGGTYSIVEGTASSPNIGVKFSPNDKNQTYTLKYDDGNGNCGSTTFKVTGCTGPEPPTPGGDCDTTKWTPQDNDAYNLALLKKAYDCTVENTDGKNGIICPGNSCDGDDYVELIIHNSTTGLSIPYNGNCHFVTSVNKYVVQYRDYTNWTEYEGALYPHLQYGRVAGQPTNFIIPPGQTVELKCKILETGCIGQTPKDFYLNYSTLNDDDDILLHRGIHPTSSISDEHANYNVVFRPFGSSTGTVSTISKKMRVEMTFNPEAKYANSWHHKFTNAQLAKGFYFYDGELTPTDLYDIYHNK